MKLKKVRALMAALALVVGTALCVSTVTWAKSLNPDPISIINEDGTIIKSAIESDRTIYIGSTQTQDIQSKILEKLCSADTIKKDNLTAKDVSITLKSELVFDEEKNEFVESENDIKDVMTIKDDKITFAKEGFFLTEVSIKKDKLNVIFDVNEEVLSYVDLNDWVVAIGTSSPDFSVKYDSEKIATVKFDSSDVHVDTKGEYVLTYEITDANNKKIEKNVLVTVVEKETVNEYVEKGVWEAQTKIIINNNGLQSNNSYKNPVLKPIHQDNNKPSDSGNQNNQPEKPQHVHTFGDWQVKKPATCEKTGLEERFCTDTTCNKKEIRKIPALGHDLKETVITEPTCGTAGSKEITCSRCDFKDTKEIPATGAHAYGDWVIVKEATCTEEGLRTQTCANCGDVKKEVLPKVDHTWNEGEVSKQPTCTENGERTFTCTVCGTSKTEVAEDLPAIGHNWSDWEVKDATCTENGLKTRHCQNDGCNEVESEVIPATGHTFGEWTVTTPATCETEGQEERTCADCNETEARVIKALGHEFVDYTYNNDATCEKDGTETAKCTRCDKTDTRVAEGTKLGHELKEEILTNPTCETAGSKKITCTRCDYEEIVEIPAIGHKWNDGEVTTAPTCTKEGVKTFTCQNDPSHTRTEVVPALGHDWSEWEIKNATCGQEGEKTRHCQRPNCIATETIKIPANENHNWNDGQETKAATCTEQGEVTYTCKDCGHTKVEKTPALGHNLKELVIKEPTCSESGLKAMVCQRPGCDHKENETVTPPTGEHHWDEGVTTKQPTCIEKGQKTYTCEHCGDKKYEEIGLIDHLWEKLFEKQPDKVVTEEHYICNQCGMDFGDDDTAAAKHIIVTQGCQNYSLKQVQVTIPGETIEVGRKCSVCNKEERH